MSNTTKPMFPNLPSDDDDTPSRLPMLPDASVESRQPLPLIVAEKWQFPLAYHIVEGQHLYAIQDWVRGITGTKDVRRLFDHFKKQETWVQLSN